MFGNLEKPEEHLIKCHNMSCDIIISEFNTDKFATDVRFDYYQNCRIENIKFKRYKNFVRFEGENFISVSHSPSFLRKILLKLKFEIMDVFANSLIQIYYCKRLL